MVEFSSQVLRVFILTINNRSERNYRGKCLGSPVTSYGGEFASKAQLLRENLIFCVLQNCRQNSFTNCGHMNLRDANLRYSQPLRIIIYNNLFAYTRGIKVQCKQGANREELNLHMKLTPRRVIYIHIYYMYLYVDIYKYVNIYIINK